MSEIKLLATVIHRLTYGELFEFCLAIIETIAALIARAPRLQSRYDTYKAVFDIYDNGFKKALSAPETEEIRNLDVQRRGIFILISDAVRKNAHYSPIPEVKAAAKALLPIFDNYSGAPDREYEEETGAIVNMLQELAKPENAAHIQRLGQAENVAALEQVNDDFQALYQTRLKNRYDFKQDGTTRQRADNLIGELDKFGRAVDGLLLSASAPDEIAALTEIAANINAIMEQYTIIVHRRLGIKASKKKTDEGSQTSGIQKPDTSPTPAPDTSDQNPSDEPHHLDPNEHPAMGE
jgi:hypothetical protein